MATTFCLDCEAAIRLPEPLRIGQRITCTACGTEMEVVEVSPLELDWAFEEPGGEWDSAQDDEWDDEEDEWDDEEEWDDEDNWDDEDDDWDDDDG